MDCLLRAIKLEKIILLRIGVDLLLEAKIALFYFANNK